MSKYTRYTPAQIIYLRQSYHLYSNHELAQLLGVDCPEKVRDLARRHGIKWRAENGAPRWRERKVPQPPNWLR